MAKSMLELGVNTGKWDAGLKKAQNALHNFVEANGGLAQALDKESDKMGKFVRMMGTVDSTAKTAKGQMNDYKSTIEQLTMQYNRMTEAQKSAVGKDYLQAIDQMKQKYQQVSEEVKNITDGLSGKNASIGGDMGGKFADAFAVFKGNMMTKAAMMVGELGMEIGSAVKEGVELAKAGEGIRMAFERLDQPGLLQSLREATHGTVTDIELMKQAVKFDDFKLPLEQMGTLLAFAQQKAKDTGQSVDYMVDSIVTGLGRQSLMILDNLGLSAAEIRERMKETGDMTTAVADIIRDQMSKAGEYVATAADRAAQANVELKNAMEELGRTFMPLSETGSRVWTDLEIGALKFLNEAVKPLISAMEYLGLLQSKTMGNSTPEQEPAKPKIQPTRTLGQYVVTSSGGRVTSAVHYDADASGNIIIPKGGGGRSSKSSAPTYAADSIAAQQAQVNDLRKMWSEAGADVRDYYLMQLNDAEKKLRKMTDDQKILQDQMNGKYLGGDIQTSGLGGAASVFDVGSGLDDKTMKYIQGLKDDGFGVAESWKAASQAVQMVGSAFASIQDPSVRAVGTVLQAVASISLGFAQAAAAKDTTASGWAWLGWLAAGTAAMATTISTIHSLTGFAEGGIVKGNSYSGDNMRGSDFGINAGELILNRAQQGNLAGALQNEARMKVIGKLVGEDIFLSADRFCRRSGRGEIVTW